MSIGPNTLEAVCDLSAAVNIIPMSVCDNVLRLAPLLKTNMRIRFTDRSTRRVEVIADNVEVLVENSHVVSDFMILNTGRDEMTPIILGRPFLRMGGATIYTRTSIFHFDIVGEIDEFSFKTHRPLSMS